MCGRYEIDLDGPLMNAIYEYAVEHAPEDTPAPKYGEIFPTNTVPTLVQPHGGPAQLTLPLAGTLPTLMTWGFKGFRSASHTIINARAETVTDKPMFASSFQERRCIIPATGFYEWSGPKGSRLRHLLNDGTDDFIFMAGLWRKETGQPKFTIITQASEGEIERIHHRMPVLIPREKIEDYLTDPTVAEALIRDVTLLPRFAGEVPSLEEQGQLDL